MPEAEHDSRAAQRAKPAADTVLILGAGVMGTAFTVPLADSGLRVLLVGTHLDTEWIESMERTRRHPKLGIRIPDAVEPLQHDELERAFAEEPELVVLGVSSPGVDWATERLRSCLPAGDGAFAQRDSTPPARAGGSASTDAERNAPAKAGAAARFASGSPTRLLMLTKGLAVSDGRITVFPHYVASRLGRGTGVESAPEGGVGSGAAGAWAVEVGGVGGPCIAGELAVRRESSVVIAGPDRELLSFLHPRLDAAYYHVRYSTDVIGVEASAALKNFYALGVGAAAGMLDREGAGDNGALTHNVAAGIFTQALIEMRHIVRYLGGGDESVNELAGTGDLYVTSMAGRNSRMGRLLGRGLRFSEARAEHMPGATIEGADLAMTVGTELLRLHKGTQTAAQSGGGKAESPLHGRLPLAAAIVRTVQEDHPFELPWASFY